MGLGGGWQERRHEFEGGEGESMKLEGVGSIQ